MSAGRILFDSDGVLTTGVTDDRSSPDWQPRPGIADLIRVLEALNYELHAWSANGADHARAAAKLCGCETYFKAFWPKPYERPITRENALDTVGFVPFLTIDDKPERVEGDPLVGFVKFESPMSGDPIG